MPTRISTAAKNDCLDAIRNLIRSGSTVSKPYISIYTGTQPASVQTAATGVELARLELSSNPFFPPSEATMVARPISDELSVNADGEATWFRIYNRDNVAILDGVVSINGGSGALQFDTTTFVLGGAVSLEALILRY